MGSLFELLLLFNKGRNYHTKSLADLYQAMKIRLSIFFFTVLLFTQLSAQYFKAVKAEDGIEIIEKGKKVLFYRTLPVNGGGQNARTNYIHPLYGLDGSILTEDFPNDHPYHHGIYWAWHQIIYKDKKIADGWINDNVRWQVIDTKTGKGKKRIFLKSTVLWKAALPDNKVQNIIRENSKITVHQSSDNFRAIDFDIELNSLIEGIKIGGDDSEKGYGGFSVRLKLPKNISFLSDNKSIVPQELGIEAGPWMDFTGSFGIDSSVKSGLTILCHPLNPVTKNTWILRKKTSMQNSVYPGKVPVEITSKGIRLRYRIIVHNDQIKDIDLQKLYDAYIVDSVK